MKKEIMICDRCGKQIESETFLNMSLYDDNKSRQQFNLRKYRPMHPATPSIPCIDLCYECKQDFYVFMEGFPLKGKGGD